MTDAVSHDSASAAEFPQFGEATREWFLGAFAAPTRVQREAWMSIADGKHTLVVAPTGSGKTLAAFLWAIDRLIQERADAQPTLTGLGEGASSASAHGNAATAHGNAATAHGGSAREPGTRILYISPLKALGVDVERNLHAPLVGIRQTALRLGLDTPKITVGVRSGDTPPAERRRQQASPPDVLITTPESLYLLLTSSARKTLRNVETVIIDEVHAVAGTKRGAHLALSLERLDALLPKPAQRIGLSATVRPLEVVAKFLGGQAPVQIVAPPSEKAFDLKLVVPVEDLNDIGIATPQQDDDIVFGDASQSVSENRAGSVWPHLEAEIVDRVLAHRSTIVFVNSRGLAERLTARLNELYEGRLLDAQASNDEEQRDESGMPASAASASAAESKSGITPRLVNAQLLAGSGGFDGAAPELARAHHGSVSKETRAEVEEALKAGRLRCVVATSSLELGIDMGDVDLVIQVESPQSVASGLQRLGRAGHQVGETSQGVLLPKHRADVLHSSVVAARMLAGSIEAIAPIDNPLDVLAQQTIAAAALDRWQAVEWLALVHRSAPFATLSRALLDSVFDLLAGKYPSDEFAHLRPRILWDREADTFEGRPGAQRLAVTSGGTIPDRGMFGVFMLTGTEDGPEASDDSTASAGQQRVVGMRVGELDEEMVYESRVGDVIALGSTSWRIREIGADRVRVAPAFGEPGRLPFWRGDAIGRPAELGEAIGATTREIATTQALPAELATILDANAANNLLAYISEQRETTGHVPSDRTLVVERTRDELGDWRVILHSPYGRRVHAPWALLVTSRVRERFGLEASAIANDDGIIVRVPDVDADPPGAELFAFERDEVESTVTREVGSSALFAARFRENAARALILPKLHPGKRSPLWQQRLRAAQLLEVARRYPDFPMILETVREVLHDVYDLDAFGELLRRIETREVVLVEVITEAPSPFARSLLFGYVGEFMYEGDQPLAERRAAALALDPNLLADLLGATSLRELLDLEAIAQVEAELQKLAPGFQARDLEGVADLLRLLGPLSVAEIAARLEAEDAEAVDPDAETIATELVAQKRALRIRVAGEERIAAIEDASRLRDALGVPLPIGVPNAFIDPVADPLGDLIGRFARTHAPFTVEQLAARFALGQAVVTDVLRRLELANRVVHGEFTPGRSGEEWVDDRVLRRIRARTLAKLRHEVEPVSQLAYARFLPEWQHLDGSLHGLDGLVTAIDQLQGVPIPASAWESLVLPARVRDYSPALLDELLAAGEVRWHGHGAIGGADGWLSLHLADTAPLTLPAALEDAATLSPLATRLLEVLRRGGAMFVPDLARELTVTAAFAASAHGETEAATPSPEPSLDAIADALWELAWAGFATTDSLVPMRSLLSGPAGGNSSSAHRAARRPARGRLYRGKFGGERLGLQVPPRATGRWSATHPGTADPTTRAQALGELFLDRYGVVTRGTVDAAGTDGGFAHIYRLLAKFEEAGQARRGYFIEQLGAAQFSTAGAVDRLRQADDERFRDDPPRLARTLAATDPANAYGAALPWPEHSSTHRPGRKAGGLVTLVDGALVLYVERGGKTMLVFGDDEQVQRIAARSLAETVRAARIPNLVVEKVNGDYVLGTPIATWMQEAGFSATPRGLRMRTT
ncbi:ATP-dependent helicase [Gulosibacter macacae]|uniref:ATP-dependent helicase n=1 Tax=Gulosibacter macacae TaxID=2488791 RepID=A0A3P3W1K4_9MICO|nr:ATP-dependent helicase [Gulosibacter macacae]RRJ86753.1 ATP-dependent helicase [Gulosibacter macacae]